jgi:hypothetical protein
MLRGIEGQAALHRHLLKPAELRNGGDHAAREEGDVGEGAVAVMREWARTWAWAKR